MYNGQCIWNICVSVWEMDTLYCRYSLCSLSQYRDLCVKSLHILAHMEQWESILCVSMPAFTWKWGFSHSVIPYKDIMHSWPLNVVAVHVKYYSTHAIFSHVQLVMPSCKHFKAVVFQNWSFRGTIKAAMLWMTFQKDTDLQQYPYMTCPLANLTVAL